MYQVSKMYRTGPAKNIMYLFERVKITQLAANIPIELSPSYSLHSYLYYTHIVFYLSLCYSKGKYCRASLFYGCAIIWILIYIYRTNRRKCIFNIGNLFALHIQCLCNNNILRERDFLKLIAT